MAPLPSQPFSAPTHSSRGAGRLALGQNRASTSCGTAAALCALGYAFWAMRAPVEKAPTHPGLRDRTDPGSRSRPAHHPWSGGDGSGRTQEGSRSNPAWSFRHCAPPGTGG